MRRFVVTLFAVVVLMSFASWGSVVPTITSVAPSPLLAPNTPGMVFSGIVSITGSDFLGGDIYTDGPLALLSTSTVDPSGTLITRPYQIGCCAPYEGETFHFFVVTGGGSASIADSITLAPEPSSLVLFGSAAVGLLGSATRRKLGLRT